MFPTIYFVNSLIHERGFLMKDNTFYRNYGGFGEALIEIKGFTRFYMIKDNYLKRDWGFDGYEGLGFKQRGKFSRDH
jgi:hypothetical protein